MFTITVQKSMGGEGPDGLLGFAGWFLVFDFMGFFEIAQLNSSLWTIHHFQKHLGAMLFAQNITKNVFLSEV